MAEHCPECGVRTPQDANFCRECGAGLDAGGPTGETPEGRPRHDAGDGTHRSEPDDGTGTSALKLVAIVLVVLFAGLLFLVVLAAIVGTFVVSVGEQATLAAGTIPVA